MKFKNKNSNIGSIINWFVTFQHLIFEFDLMYEFCHLNLITYLHTVYCNIFDILLT